MIFHRLRHRGPDWSGIHCHEDCYLAHQRLAIIDPTSGDQPLYNEDKTVVVTVCNQKWNKTSILYFFMPTGVYFSI
jgi:asparagine synthase (glutamine-hydrolysing)